MDISNEQQWIEHLSFTPIYDILTKIEHSIYSFLMCNLMHTKVNLVFNAIVNFSLQLHKLC